MSVSERGRVPPKKGRILPSAGGVVDAEAQYAEAIAAALRSDLGRTHQAVKTVMRWTGAGERTVKAWMAGVSGPSGARLIALMRNSEAVLSAVLTSAGRKHVLAAGNLALLQRTLFETAYLIQSMMDD